MKNIFLSTLIAASFGLAFVGCNGAYDANPDIDNSNIDNPLNPGKPYEGPGATGAFDWTGKDPMSAKVDGVDWQATGCTFVEDIQDHNYNVIGGFTVDTTTSTISMSFPKTVKVGEVYEFGPNFPAYTVTYAVDFSPNGFYASNFIGGKMKILEIDAAHIKGLFYLTGKNPYTNTKKNITHGYFNAIPF